MAELADALDSGSSEGFLMQVQVLLSAFWRMLMAAPNILKIGVTEGLLLFSLDFEISEGK